MPLWGNIDAANNAPKWKNITVGSSTHTTGNVVYANTTVGAFQPNVAEGVFGVDVAEAHTLSPKSIGPGWVLTKQGTGSIVGVTVPAETLSYNNTDVIRVTSTQAGGNAVVNFSTNATGGILTTTITTPGSGFLTVNNTITVTNATGGTATGNATATGFVATAGGRAGRINREILAVVKGMANNSVSGGGSTTP